MSLNGLGDGLFGRCWFYCPFDSEVAEITEVAENIGFVSPVWDRWLILP